MNKTPVKNAMLLRSSDKNLLMNQTSLLVSVGQLFCCLHVATPGTQVSNYNKTEKRLQRNAVAK